MLQRRTKRPSLFLLFTVSLLVVFVNFDINNNLASHSFYDVRSTFDSIAPTTSKPNSFANQTRPSVDTDRDAAVPPPKNSIIINDDVGGGGSAICLMAKDDNHILAEWVAYHYHVFNLRRLIVAVDPTSKTSPSDVLEPFRKSNGNFNLDLTIWHDEDYTPTWFHSEDVDPSSYINGRMTKNGEITCGPLKMPDKAASSNNSNNNKTFTHATTEQDIIPFCKQRKRQVMFYAECLLKMQTENKNSDSDSWTALIESDEYIVPNPWIAEYIHNDDRSTLSQETLSILSTRFKGNELQSMYPDTPSAGSLWSFFHRFQETAASSAQTTNNTCVMFPRITFGGKEDDSNKTTATTAITTPIASSSASSSNPTTTIWSHKNFESLRWKYHADHNHMTKPKAILNAAGLEKLDEIIWGGKSPKPILGVNVPHKSCDGKVWDVYNPNLFEQPLAIYNYLGSLERFQDRPGDASRTIDWYNQQTKNTDYARGDKNNPSSMVGSERWWIKGWLDSFVATHGSKKVYTVLGKNYANTTGGMVIADGETTVLVVQKAKEVPEKEESYPENKDTAKMEIVDRENKNRGDDETKTKITNNNKDWDEKAAWTKMTPSKRKQIENYQNGTALIVNIHPTHHGGTTLCNRIKNNGINGGIAPGFACMADRTGIMPVPPDWCDPNDRFCSSYEEMADWDKVPWFKDETGPYINNIRPYFHMIGWEFTIPRPESVGRSLDDTPWDHQNLVSVIIMRHPISRLLANDGTTRTKFPGYNKGTMNRTMWWDYSVYRWDFNTDNFLLRILTTTRRPWLRTSQKKIANHIKEGINRTAEEVAELFPSSINETHFEHAKSLLHQFTFVLDIECLNDGIDAMGRMLNLDLPPVSKERKLEGFKALSPRERIGYDDVYEYLLLKNQWDIALYEYSKTISLVQC